MTTQTAAQGGPVKPIKDPQPSVDRIDDLAKRILTGDIYLPKFQREFVWEKQQVLDLLDSVARNYPIGSVLLWQSKQELRSESRIAVHSSGVSSNTRQTFATVTIRSTAWTRAS